MESKLAPSHKKGHTVSVYAITMQMQSNQTTQLR